MLSYHGRQHDGTTTSFNTVREKLTFDPENLHETGTIVRADTTRLRIRERRPYNRLITDGGWRVEPRLRGDKIETNGFEEAVQSLPTTDFRVVNLPRRPKVNADDMDGNFSGMVDETANDPESFSTYSLDSLDFLWLRIHNDWAHDAAEPLALADGAAHVFSSNKRVKSSANISKSEKVAEPPEQSTAVPIACSERDLRVTLSLLELEANELIMNKISAQIDACRKVKTSLGLMLAEQDALKRWRSWSKNIARFVDYKTIAERSRVSLQVTTEIFSYWLLKRYFMIETVCPAYNFNIYVFSKQHHGSFYLAKNCTEPQRFDVERIRWQIFLLVIRGWLRNLRHDGERMRMLNDGLIRVKKLRKRLFQKRTELHRLMLDVVDDAEFDVCFECTSDGAAVVNDEKHASNAEQAAEAVDDAANSFIERLLGVCDVVDDDSLLPPIGTPPALTTILMPDAVSVTPQVVSNDARRVGRKPKKRRLDAADNLLATTTAGPSTISATSNLSAGEGGATNSDGPADSAVADRPPSPRALRKRVRLTLPPQPSLPRKDLKKQRLTAPLGDVAKSSDDELVTAEAKKQRLSDKSHDDDDLVLLDEIAAVVTAGHSATTSGNSSIKTMSSTRNVPANASKNAVDDDDSRSTGYNSLSGASIDGDEAVVIGSHRRKRKLPKTAAAVHGGAVAAKKRQREDADADSSVVLDESSSNDEVGDDEDGEAVEDIVVSDGEEEATDNENTVVGDDEENGDADAFVGENEDGENDDKSVVASVDDGVGRAAESNGEDEDIENDADEQDADVEEEAEVDAEEDEKLNDDDDDVHSSSSERSRSRASSAVAASVDSENDDDDDNDVEEFKSSTSASTYTSARSRRSNNSVASQHYTNKFQRTSGSSKTPARRVRNSKMVARFVTAQHATTTKQHRSMPSSSRKQLAAEHPDHHLSNAVNAKLLGGLALGRVNNDALVAASSNVRLTRSSQQQSLALYEKQKAAAEGGMHAEQQVTVPVQVAPHHPHRTPRPPPVVIAHHGYLRPTYHRMPQTRR